MIELIDVSKRFAGTDADAVEHLSLTIEQGEVVALVGPSGCGKTTTLRMINRLIEPSSGKVTVAGSDVSAVPLHELRRNIGYVIQQVGLFPHRTVEQNIATVPSLLGWDSDRVRSRVDELVDLVAIDRSILQRYPSELSGGQRQRVGVARALAADPPVLLMDEPFGAVDPVVREHLQRELLDLQARLRKTIVFVTHDIDEAILVGDRVAILNTGGVLEQFAMPGELLAHPANPFVAGFLGTDRAIKRLSLLPIDGSSLEPLPPDGIDYHSAGAIDIGVSLKEALDAIVSGNGHHVAVFDGTVCLGVVTIDMIHRRLAG
ncbi:MAG: ATP-binding cassette domain-containing protein [Armatimonadetes bacterium]|nr:MAG: ATP-binding cassette domain-containing protein [Armatimonadota bacterium]